MEKHTGINRMADYILDLGVDDASWRVNFAGYDFTTKKLGEPITKEKSGRITAIVDNNGKVVQTVIG